MRTLLSLTIVFCTELCAQTTFAPLGAKWTYTQHHVGTADTNLFVIQCVADTIIQGRTCSKLTYTEGVNGCMPFFPALTMQGDSVLAYQPIFFNFSTLYVFGQAPGSEWETIIDYPFGTDTLRWTVLDTGHVTIDGLALRSQTVSASANGPYATASLTSGTMIERLGDLKYLFPWISGVCDMENNGPLRCYDDPEINWLNPEFPQCDLSTGLAQQSLGLGFLVSPSVVDRGENIHITSVEPVLVELLDAPGRVIRQGRTNATLSIEKSGIYFVRANDGQRTIGVRRVLVR